MAARVLENELGSLQARLGRYQNYQRRRTIPRISPKKGLRVQSARSSGVGV